MNDFGVRAFSSCQANGKSKCVIQEYCQWIIDILIHHSCTFDVPNMRLTQNCGFVKNVCFM